MNLTYNYMYCVVCGGPAGYDHHCPPEKIRRIEAGRKGHEDRDLPAPLYGRRLHDGFAIMEDDENEV